MNGMDLAIALRQFSMPLFYALFSKCKPTPYL